MNEANTHPFDREARLAGLAQEYRCRPDSRQAASEGTQGLIQLCREWVRPDWHLVEVGSFRGISTRVFACFALKVWAVDPWTMPSDYRDLELWEVQKAEDEFAEACWDYPNIERVRAFSVDAARSFLSHCLHAVYIDGDHREAAFGADVVAWLPKLRPDGLLMGHDYSTMRHYFAALHLPDPAATYPEDSWVVRVEDLPR